MKLVLVNYEYPPLGGGAGNATAYLARALADLGHDVTVVTSGFRDSFGASEDAGVHLLRLRTRRSRLDRASVREMLSYVLRAAIALPHLARRIRPDGLIVFFSLPCGPLGWLTRLLNGTPYVIALRGGDVPGTEVGIAWMQRLLTPVRRRVLRCALAVTANSTGLAALSRKADPIPVIIIPNGVDTVRFHPAKRPSPNDSVSVLFAGRFNHQKNLRVLLSHFAAALARESSLTLSMVGDGPHSESLHALAQELGLAHVITWHGWLDKESLAELYRSSDIFVNPSLYEGMPNTVLEAMASGLPVIASRVAGNDELVEHGTTGILFDLASPSELSESLLSLARDPDRRHALGVAARTAAVERYSWQATAKSYAACFQNGVTR